MNKMEQQKVIINGKTRSCVIIRGQEYVRKGYDLPVYIAETFEQKCDLLGEDESKIVERFVTAFVEVNGWGEEVKRVPVFEKRSGYHIKDALNRVRRGLFPWRMNNN